MAGATESTDDHAASTAVHTVERTFLFSDIEGSTPLWERQPRLMSAALVLHDRVVTEAIESNGGTVFKHTGDGIVAWFDDPADGVRGASAMQHAMLHAEWHPDLALRIRVGLHHGEAEARGDDFFGRTLNLAARIMSAGQANQVLISGAVLDRLAIDHGLDLRDEGACSLKGISEPVPLWTVLLDGVPGDFAPVALAGQAVSTIPVVPDDLVGRVAELEQIADALQAHRLVTLAGPPGTGKTRLAIEAATRALPGHPGGVHVIELASLREVGGVGDAVATTVLGPEPIAGENSAIGRLAAGLNGEVLLVLDNCEHVLDGVADFVFDLMAELPQVRFLLTSREPLLAGGEQVLNVEPLDAGRNGAATQLFMQRARAVRSDITDLDLDRVADLCERLDGLPLAIELAAARLDVLQLDELSERLFDVLGSSRSRRRRRQEDRHATVEAAVRWSWDLLDDDEREVLKRASVFVGTFDLDAASRVCGGDEYDPVEMIDLIGSLQDRSFISSVWVESGNRFRLLEIVRTFAASQLADDDLEALRRRHQDHYAAVSSQLQILFDRKPDPEVIAQLELDDANFVAALNHTEGGSIRTARKLAMQLHTYWEETGRLPDGFVHARRLIEPEEPRSGLWRAVVGLMVTYAAMVGRLDEVSEFESVLEELVGGDPDISAMNAYFALGFAGLARGHLTDAAEWFEVAAEVVAPFDGGTQRQALMTAGSCLAYSGDPASALDRYGRAHAVPGEAQGWFADYAAVFEASAHVQLDPSGAAPDLDAWCQTMDTSLTSLADRQLGFRVTVAAHQAAVAFAMAGRTELFERWAPMALRMARENGHRWAVALGVELLAWGAAWRGEDTTAISHWAVADRVFAEAGYGLPAVHRGITDVLRAEVAARVSADDAESARAAAAAADLAVHVAAL